MSLITLVYNLLISFFVVFSFGNYIGRFGGFLFSTVSIFLSFSVAWVYFFNFFLVSQNTIVVELGGWFKVQTFSVSWNFLFDSLSIIMLLIILTVSLFVHIFSFYYMYNDPYSNKFMSFISLFTFFMVLLVTSSNFVMLFLGWEGVGLCSFLLISFWSSRLQANKSAVKAMLLNRVGDFFIISAILLIFVVCKSVDFYVVFSQIFYHSAKCFNFCGYTFNLVDFICLLLFLGAITKSAQIGFHGWLPDAMEGPTPVPALIHAATMVTAGVFLLIRCSYLFELSPFVLRLAVYFGVFSIVVFGLIGLFQNDIKKVIAYSTCSQLGYMVLACGLSGYNIALFHLFNHAFFKALLFLSAGSIIHFMGNEQDLRRLSGIFNLAPFTSICFLIGSMSLVGLPFLSGFYSKDAILELLYFKYYDTNYLLFIMANCGVFLTMCYSLKIVYYLFLKPNFNHLANFKWFVVNFNLVNVYTHYNFSHHFPLFVLSLLSIFSGYFFRSLFLGIGEDFFFNSIFIYRNFQLLHAEFAPYFIKLTPLVFNIVAFILFFYYNKHRDNFIFYKLNSSFWVNLRLIFNRRFFFDSIFNLYISIFFLKLSYKIFFILDKGFVEVFGPLGLSRFFFKLYKIVFMSFSSGKVDHYLSLMFFIVVFILFIVLILVHTSG